MTDTTHTLVFREEDGSIRCTFATTVPAYRAGTGICLQMVDGDDKFPCMEWTQLELEELHQFTFEILAGRRGDPRLDVVDTQIMCGGAAYSPANGSLECCLVEGHLRVGDYGHITSTGIMFDGTPGF